MGGMLRSLAYNIKEKQKMAKEGEKNFFPLTFFIKLQTNGGGKITLV